DDDELGQKNLAVARAAVNVLEESTVGAIVTQGEPATTFDNTTGGLDFNYRNSHFNGDHVLEGHGWLLASHSTSDEFGDDAAFGGRIDYPNDDLRIDVNAAQIGKGF